MFHDLQSRGQEVAGSGGDGDGNGGAGNFTARASLGAVQFHDLYGFVVEGDVEDVNVLNEVRERVREQGRVWSAMESSKGTDWYQRQPVDGAAGKFAVPSSLNLSAIAKTITGAFSLRKLVRKGVPPALRPKVWLSVSGAAKKKSTVPESYYEDLTMAVAGQVTPATRQIDYDLPRTFPGQPRLDSLESQASLRRILAGYSLRDSNVGYCQGLNYVAALLLLVMENEEDAFWMLAVLLENVLADDCYTYNLSGCHNEQAVFKDLFVKKCPKIAAHLESLGFDVSLVTTEWFLCLFSKSLPSETTLRVWDVLFNEGAQILFQVALAIFKMKEDQLLVTNQIGEVINILQATTDHLYDPDQLMTVAFDKIGPIPANAIAKQRRDQKPTVMKELDYQLQRLKFLKYTE